MPTIDLTEGVGLGVIIQFASGVEYTQQTGGFACLRPRLEGVYVPLRNDCTESDKRLLGPETDLFEYFSGPKYRGSGATRGLDQEDLTFLEEVLRRFALDDVLQIDRTRRSESHEAWVWCNLVGENEFGPFAGFGPYPRAAVLTWTNSD